MHAPDGQLQARDLACHLRRYTWVGEDRRTGCRRRHHHVVQRTGRAWRSSSRWVRIRLTAISATTRRHRRPLPVPVTPTPDTLWALSCQSQAAGQCLWRGQISQIAGAGGQESQPTDQTTSASASFCAVPVRLPPTRCRVHCRIGRRPRSGWHRRGCSSAAAATTTRARRAQATASARPGLMRQGARVDLGTGCRAQRSVPVEGGLSRKVW